MTIFAVLAEKPNAELGLKIESLYPNDFYKLSDAEWLISADTIADTVADRLDVKQGKFDRVIVIQTKGTGAGWHAKTAWEWLRQKTAGA